MAESARRRLRALLVAAMIVSCAGTAYAEGERLAPRATDKCPVCGMFVAKYPDFLAAVVYRDGSSAFFDGPKDMFKYLLNLRAHAPSRTAADVAAVHVTDYYALTRIDGRSAWYVLGSDVTGPMGRELVPFRNEPEAREFMKDHRGRALLRFGDVTVEVVKGLD